MKGKRSVFLIGANGIIGSQLIEYFRADYNLSFSGRGKNIHSKKIISEQIYQLKGGPKFGRKISNM